MTAVLRFFLLQYPFIASKSGMIFARLGSIIIFETKEIYIGIINTLLGLLRFLIPELPIGAEISNSILFF